VFTLSGPITDGDLKQVRVMINTTNNTDGTPNFATGYKAFDVDNISTTTGTSGFTYATGVYNFSYALSSAVYNNTSYVKEGPNTIRIFATDVAGTMKEWVYKDNQPILTFTKDTGKPYPVYSNLKGIPITKAEWDDNEDPKKTTISSFATPEVRGSFEDQWSPIGATLDTSANAKTTQYPNGQYYFEYKLYDKGQFLNTPGSVTPKRYYLGDNPLSTENWTINLYKTGTTTILDDGTYWLDFDVSDRAGNQRNTNDPGATSNDQPKGQYVVNSIAFTVDTKDPELRITAPVDKNKAYNGAFAISGYAWDGNLNNVVVTVDNSTGTVTLGTIYAAQLTTGMNTGVTRNEVWSLAVGLDTDSNSWASKFNTLDEGPHTITVTASDLAGKKTIATYPFIKDKTGPELKFSNIAKVTSLTGVSTLTGDTATEITGTFGDTYSNIASATYGLYRQGDAAVANTTSTITIPSGTLTSYGWSIPLGSTLLDGQYWVLIRVVDSLGNVNSDAGTAYTFKIDRKAPLIVVDKPPMKDIYNNNDSYITLQGSVTDGDLKFGATALTYRVNSLSATGTTFTTNPATVSSTGVYSWNLGNLNLAGSGAGNLNLGEGKHTIYISASDDAGRTTNLPVPFIWIGLRPRLP